MSAPAPDPGRTYTQQQVSDIFALVEEKAADAEQRGHSNPYKFAFGDLKLLLGVTS